MSLINTIRGQETPEESRPGDSKLKIKSGKDQGNRKGFMEKGQLLNSNQLLPSGNGHGGYPMKVCS